MKKIFLIILALGVNCYAYTQSKEDKEKAYNTAIEALNIMDNGEIDESIKMLEESHRLDPKNYLYPYELGYAYYLKKDFENAIKKLKEVINFKENNDQCFTLLGNIYDEDKQPAEAIKIYEKGLKKFPKSGRLHFERGIVYETLERYNEALDSFENGILVEPVYSSNYHISAIYYCEKTSEKLWGLLYGELFMNIERGSEKTNEISELLYDTYNSSIIIKSNEESIVSFSKSNQIAIPSKGKKFKFPFSMPFEMTMALAVISELENPDLGIKSFNNIRTSFINNWFQNKRNKEFPNIVFDWHKKLIDLNYFEPYNYWLLMKGNETEFNEWYDDNTEAFDNFIKWFTDNPLVINKRNNFHRLQYN